jgi:ATP-binding cassette, subfamily B, bacterial MsbA
MSQKLHSETRWLFAQVKLCLRLYLAGLCCILIGSVLLYINPLIMKWLLDEVLPYRRLDLLPKAILALFLSCIGSLVVEASGSLLNFRATQKMIFQIRLDLLRRLQRLSVAQHEEKTVGDTMFRLEQDVEQIGEFTSQIAPFLLRTFIVTTLALITMIRLSPVLTSAIIILIPIFLLIRWRFRNTLRECSDTVQKQSGILSGFLQEHLTAIVQIQLLSRELKEARRFTRLAGNVVRAQLARKRLELLSSLLSSLTVALSVVGILAYGGYQVIVGTLSVGGLVAFHSYAIQIFVPLQVVLDTYFRLQRAGASIRRLLEIANAEPLVIERPGALPLAASAPLSMKLKDVNFRYKSDKPVLTGINFQVGSGEKLAIVGASGSGKSTIAKLLARLYDLDDGVILVDGQDIRNIKLKSLRSAICFVPQEAMLFDATLRENLLYGNPAAGQSDLENAGHLAQLQGLIKRLPKGWDEPIGAGGNKLSGGERQRIALARSILQNPRILILDESTSALDPATEKNLLEALSSFMRGKTVIVISHRLSTIAWADRVLILDQGMIIAEEGPDQLSQKDSFYQRIYSKVISAEPSSLKAQHNGGARS